MLFQISIERLKARYQSRMKNKRKHYTYLNCRITPVLVHELRNLLPLRSVCRNFVALLRFCWWYGIRVLEWNSRISRCFHILFLQTTLNILDDTDPSFMRSNLTGIGKDSIGSCGETLNTFVFQFTLINLSRFSHLKRKETCRLCCIAISGTKETYEFCVITHTMNLPC